ncbi:hypothetical protein BYT27DRAFT_7341509 [Phlegmacium glaucopus]|nr:hypothetical protein BYT27DRAFT_7341509 [Phlegmacium glaucopus]
MGQSSSKRQDTSLSSDSTDTTSSPNPVAGASTDLHPDSARDSGDDSSSSQPESPRSPSIRKSILNFVKPSNIRSRVNSIASHPGDVRRSWRNSMRRPKDSPPASSSVSSTAGPSTTSLSPTDKGKNPERNDSDDSDLGDVPTPVDLDVPIEELPSPIPLLASDMPHDIQTTPEILATTESLEPIAASPVDDETNTLYVSDTGEPEPEPEYQPPVYHQEGPEPLVAPLPQPSFPPQPTPRQFPPPGTLVVVQGIVHTTDVSRNNSPGTDSNSTSTSTLRPVPTMSETSTESGTSRTRNRLSALLRPRSTSSRPSSTINDSVPSVTITPPAEPHSPLSSSAEPEVSEEPTNQLADALQDQPPLEDPPPLPTEHQHQTPSISSSSIDVLGTLLSVAAAATAASLLTGSSEPILSSGLAPPNPSIPSTNNNVPPIPNTPLADISAAGRAERMRHAWGTIRERLGLRPSAPSEQDTRNTDVPVVPPTTTTTPTDPATPISLPDTRELMLAEMTRAFNLGFGLNGNGLGGGLAGSGNGNNEAEGESAVMSDANNTNSNQEPTDSGTPPLATLPPEGSFDRFLMDLQIDLRTALTQVEDLPPAPTHPHPQGRQSTASEPQDTEAGTENTNGAGSFSASSETQHGVDQHEDHHLQGSPEGIHVVNIDSDRSSVPDLSEIYDTDSEFEDAEEDPDDDDFHSTRHASNHNPPQSPTLGAGRIDASGRINWWRLYRFPPVMPPRLDMANFRPALPTMTSSTAATTEPPSSSDAATSPSPTSTPTQNQEPPTQQAVVPVIVVGLQSVNSDWRPDMPSPDENDMDIFGHPHGVGGAEAGGGGGGGGSGHETFGEDDDFDGFGNFQQSEPLPDEAAGGTAGRGRGLRGGRGRARGWPSRAANAIRNLRPGRRPPPPGTQHSVTTPGSRTFLIYVIGGYYPPDHTIVTGGPNNLDSFEALLELADLLGQVKPPTVSKDDIEKSGLEIIKAGRLSQDENDGKVSSNCLDRCLICLDDYQPEEDIRIMSCRHAFHKTCVDEWLQTGRNNCPACRTTGVTPGIGSFVPPPRT